jgi:hypothetical protein
LALRDGVPSPQALYLPYRQAADFLFGLRPEEGYAWAEGQLRKALISGDVHFLVHGFAPESAAERWPGGPIDVLIELKPLGLAARETIKRYDLKVHEAQWQAWLRRNGLIPTPTPAPIPSPARVPLSPPTSIKRKTGRKAVARHAIVKRMWDAVRRGELSEESLRFTGAGAVPEKKYWLPITAAAPRPTLSANRVTCFSSGSSIIG